MWPVGPVARSARYGIFPRPILWVAAARRAMQVISLLSNPSHDSRRNPQPDYGRPCAALWLDLRIALVGELRAGEVTAGNACIAVPTGADGSWTVSAGRSAPVFVTTATA